MLLSDAYKILGLQAGATPAEIKSAYRLRCSQYHPDKMGGDPAAEVLFRMVREAYELLQNPPSEPTKPGGVPVWFKDLLAKIAAKESREELSGLLGDTDRADALQSSLRVFLKMTSQKKTTE